MALKIKRQGIRAQYRLGLGFRPGPDDFRHTSPIPKSWIAILIIAAIDAVFLFPGVTVFNQAASSWGRMDDLFDLVTALFMTGWLMGWSLVPLVLTTLLLVMLLGKEVVCVGHNRLCLFIGLPGIGLLASYRLDAVRNLRLEHPPKKSGKSWRGPHAAFDYGANASEFGFNLDEYAYSKLRSEIELAGGHSIRTRDATAEELAGEWEEQYKELKTLLSTSAAESEELVSEPVSISSASTILLVLANFVPLAGAAFYGWDLAYVLLIYWAESAVIGFYNLCKMWVIGKWLALFMGLFFLGHFGAFMAVHFLFLHGIFIEGVQSGSGGDLSEVRGLFVEIWPALAALFLSHGFSFVTNFIGRKEYRARTLQTQMHEPYSRIIFMHMVLILGGGLALILGDQGPVLVLVIVVKIVVDVRSHLKQREPGKATKTKGSA